jgi:glyoxylase-like metal-dependent hydrolase (beta-lactamase superfamily II)
VYGDGSVVIALAGGHTTGSVIVFVTPPTGPRYAFIGDLTWQIDGIRRRAERPWLISRLADSDPAQLRRDLLRVIALDDLLHIVPAHDLSAYDGIPLLVPDTATPAR